MYDIKKTFEPESLAEALSLLEKYPEAVLVAGGTDMMIRIRDRKLKEAVLVSLLNVQELKGITKEDDGTIRIGAGTCFTDIVNDPLVNGNFPFLAEACRQVGSPQIRNIATIGGNLSNGAVSADSVPSLYVLDAVLEIASAGGIRRIPIHGFHTGPGKTILSHGEILAAIRIEKKNYDGFGGGYCKFGQRRAMEISTLGCAAAVKLTEDKGHVDTLKIAYGVAGPVPLRCRKLEEALAGSPVDEAMFERIRREAILELKPRDSWRASLELREQLIRTLGERAVKAAVSRAGGEA